MYDLLMNFSEFISSAFEYPPAVRQSIEEKIRLFSQLSEDLPVFIIHDRKTKSVVYMSETGLENLGVTMAELRAMGDQYYTRFFNPEDVAHYLASWEAFEANPGDKDSWFTFFQQVAQIGAEQARWFLSVSKVITYDEETGSPLFALTLALKLNSYLPIAPKLERLVHENNFLRENLELFSSLTKKEKEILQLMSLGKSLKDIAATAFSSQETVRTHRRNIKRKLKVKNDVDLIRFAQAFNLV